MSANRQEFGSTTKSILTRLEALTGAIDTAVSTRFDQADETVKAERSSLQALVLDLQEAWDMPITNISEKSQQACVTEKQRTWSASKP